MKSESLAKEEAQLIKNSTEKVVLVENKSYTNKDVVRIKPLTCYNDFVAVIQFKMAAGSILLSNDQGYRNEGIIIGVSTLCKSDIKVGDTVIFNDRQVVHTINSDSGVYKDQRVIIMSERSLILKSTTPVEFVIEDATI